MKNLKSNILLVLIGITLLFTQSCKKIKSDEGILANNNVIANIHGLVTNELGTINIENAIVSIGSYTTQTDKNGYFCFKNVSVPKHATTVYINKSNFFKGSRTFMVKEKQTNVVKIGLIEKGTPETFISSTGGVINVSSDLSIKFPSNGIVNKATNTIYNGQVLVYAHKIDPTTEVGRNSMPGDLRGKNINNKECLLQSFGMMVAELYSTNGQLLQIASGSEVEISMKIPNSLLSNSPTTIPLWYFDEEKGIWIEEGQASLIADKYVGKVNHFSFWNCDLSAPAIDLEMILVDQNGSFLSGYTIQLINISNNDTSYGYPNSTGWVGGLVYQNATLTLNVYPPSNICGFSSPSLYSQTIVTSSANINLGTITVPITTVNSCIISGTIVDCSSNPISNSCVILMPYFLVITPNSLGQFSYTLPCTPTAPITINTYDITNSVYGSNNITLTSGVNFLGTLNACGSMSPYFSVNITNLTTLVNFTGNF
jgi:hypothetical protein